MNRFRDLNAAPRLMISFGCLIVITAGVGTMWLVNLNSANERLKVLDRDDMVGLTQANQICQGPSCSWPRSA
jgi:hypothetical protein